MEAAHFEKGGLTLLYALVSGSDSGDFFVYNESTGKLQYFVQIYNIENRYIVPIEAQDTPPAQFKAGQMPWNGFELPAYVLEDKSIENADVFYLLYAVSNEGERGFYLYDSVEGTYQRLLNYTGAKTAPVVSEDGGIGKTAIIIIAVMALLLVGAIMLIVNMIIKNKEMQEDALYEKKAKPKKAPARKPVATPKPAEAPKPATAPKPTSKKVIIPQPEEEDEKELVKTVEKPVEKPQTKEEGKSVEKVQPKRQETPAPTVRPTRQLMQTDHVVTMQPRSTEGVVGTTGNIPIKVVPAPKSEIQRPSVPIFTLEKPSDLDDDFEFEFINIDND